MWSSAAAAVDVFHAALMATWIFGMPLLFIHRFPRLTFAYGVYAITFVVASRFSHWVGGECFLTTISRNLWQAGTSAIPESNEWFTVRLARFVFGLTPSERSIAVGSEALVLITALGALIYVGRKLGVRPATPDAQSCSQRPHPGGKMSSWTQS